MAYRGHVENGLIVLDAPAKLPEGSEVEVHPIEAAERPATDEESIPTLAERLKEFIGCIEGLPSDLADNHDHYLYGVPKRKKQ